VPSRRTVYERNAPPPALVEAALAGSERAVFWLQDGPAPPRHDPLVGHTTADLTVVGGGYAGLWTAVQAKRRNPAARVVLLEGQQIGWAASGRNGGFCEASLTHGAANGRHRWPGEYDELERLGAANLDAFAADVVELGLDCQFERSGQVTAAVEPHQVEWARAAGGFLDRDAVRAEINSSILLAGSWDREGCALLHPARLAHELARVAAGLGVEIHEHSQVTELDRARSGPVAVRTARGSVRSGRVALATNVFPALLRRARLYTVPIYDYVLMTEPLSAAQWGAVGWRNRQGLADMANQFHYVRPTADGRILFGGYDAIYRYGRRVKESYEDRPASYRRLASHFFTMFPQLEGLRFTHRWAGAIDTCTQFCAYYGLARGGRVAYTAGFTGLGVGAARFAADVMLDQLGGVPTPRTGLVMVRHKPVPFPPEPIASAGIQFARWSLDRADHREGRRNPLMRVLDRLGLGFDS
jgi:glycine/D-amino acid oxidase-like deaminating enzyme